MAILETRQQLEEADMAAKRKKAKAKRKKGVSPNHQGTRPAEKGILDQKLEELEAKLITASLKRHDGSIRAAAFELGCNRGGLYKRMMRLGIEYDDYRAA
jgi:DNA-binding NtrC family response regulator